MGKNAIFSGQPIFSQIINFIPKSALSKIVKKHEGDRYVKKFNTFHHLVTMLYAQFQNCNSLREVEIGMLACEGKLNHLGIYHLPKKSTLAEANARRSHQIFEEVYFSILAEFKWILTDSRKALLDDRLYILDATVITLFQNILLAAGREPLDGKRKGGVKVHALLNAATDVPDLIVMRSAASRDSKELQNIRLPPKSILVFDKGYVSFDQYNRFTKENVYWVTRKTVSWNIEVTKNREVDEHQKINGVRTDQEVLLGNTHNKKQTRVAARLVVYYDQESQREFEFVTNNLSMSSSTVAQIYEKRWQVEVVFKRIKQSSQLYNFLGDNENAIKIQIWCSLIADLITKIIQAISKRRLAYSNIATLIRLHLMSYVDLIKFLKDPVKAYRNNNLITNQKNLFSSA